MWAKERGVRKSFPHPRQRGPGPQSQRPLVNLQVLDQRPDYLWANPGRNQGVCVLAGEGRRQAQLMGGHCHSAYFLSTASAGSWTRGGERFHLARRGLPLLTGQSSLGETAQEKALSTGWGLGRKLSWAPPRAAGTGNRMGEAWAEQASPRARVHFVGVESQENGTQGRA